MPDMKTLTLNDVQYNIVDQTAREQLSNIKDGYTPVKGVDYWTEQDKTEIVNEVISSLINGDEVAYG